MAKTKRNDPHDIEAQLRQLIEDSGRSQQSIAAESGVSPTQLSRFVREERSLKLTTVNKLAKVLGFTITKT